MNPLLVTDSNSSKLTGYLWTSFLTIDSETLKFTPLLASSVTVSKDKKTYTINLQPKAVWQDGTPVTTDDVVFTMELIKDPKNPLASSRIFFGDLKYKVLSPKKIEFYSEKPTFLTFIHIAGFVPIQKKQFESSKDFVMSPGIMNPIGNGPYSLEKFERGHQIVLKRNKNWWGYEIPEFKDRFNLDSVIFRIIQDPLMTYEAFLKKDVDVVEFSPSQWTQYVEKRDKALLASRTDLRIFKFSNKAPRPYSYIGWNLTNPLFKSAKTRRAISYLVNYDYIRTEILGDLVMQCSSPFGSLAPSSDSSLRKSLYTFDPKKALALLKEEGWIFNPKEQVLMKDGLKFEFSLKFNQENESRLKIAQVLKEDLKKYGIRVNLIQKEWNLFIEEVSTKKNFDAVLLGWTGGLFSTPKQMFHSTSMEGGSNFVSYKNDEIDKLIDSTLYEFSNEKRDKKMRAINRILYEEGPYTFLFEEKYILEGVSKKLDSKKWIETYADGVDSSSFFIAP